MSNCNDSSHNSGNSLVILKLLSLTNKKLKEHLTCPVARNPTYISPKIQNEIIKIMAYDVVHKYLIDEIKTAKFFTILADEVESHHVEQLPFV